MEYLAAINHRWLRRGDIIKGTAHLFPAMHHRRRVVRMRPARTIWVADQYKSNDVFWIIFGFQHELSQHDVMPLYYKAWYAILPS